MTVAPFLLAGLLTISLDISALPLQPQPEQCRSISVTISSDSVEVPLGDRLAAKIRIKNVSEEKVEIKYRQHPLQYVRFLLYNEEGRNVGDRWYGRIFAAFADDQVLTLTPGKEYVSTISPFVSFPREERRRGRYILIAIYDYNERIRADSNAVFFSIK
jgi:hypothetical protein